MALINEKFYQRSPSSQLVRGSVSASATHNPAMEHIFKVTFRQEIGNQKATASRRLSAHLTRAEAEELRNSLNWLLRVEADSNAAVQA